MRVALSLLACFMALTGCKPTPPPSPPVATTTTTLGTEAKLVEPTEVKEPTKRNEKTTGTKHALLVGVTKYDRLKNSDLQGPVNDVALLRSVLIERFEFAAADIVTLTENAGLNRRPIHANIKDEIERLAGIVKADDQVVILLSGHGGQILDQNPPQADDPEPDGLDEAFLPADVNAYEKGVATANAIRDDDLGQWLTKITDRGAYVWLIADSCHSGTVLRDIETERPRKVSAKDLGIPPEELAAAAKRASVTRAEGGFLQNFESNARLVATYASRADEPTFECPLPLSKAGAEWHGLLTFSLCRALSEQRSERPLTYRELLEKVSDTYRESGRNGPTPSVEGTGQNRDVLGVKTWPNPPYRLLAKQAGSWKVDGGMLHGFAVGSIFAVFDPAGSRDTPVGHVRLTSVSLATAEVVPCEHAGLPVPAKMPARGTCSPVLVEFGDLRLPVAVDSRTLAGAEVPTAERERLQTLLDKLSQEKGSIVKAAEKLAAARWLLVADGAKTYLMPAISQAADAKGTPMVKLGPYEGDDAETQIRARLTTIARAETLVELAGSIEVSRGAGVSEPGIEIEMIRFKNKEDIKPTVMPPGVDPQDGDIVGFRIHNRRRRTPIFVSVFFIGSDHGIKPVYPKKGSSSQAIAPNESFDLATGNVSSSPPGRDYAVVIATTEPVDLSNLAQPGARLRGPGEPPPTPLAQLLERGVQGQGGLRGGFAPIELNVYALARTTWYTRPMPKKN